MPKWNLYLTVNFFLFLFCLVYKEADIDELKNKSRGRRHSIVRGRQVSVTDHYHTSNDPVPLFINRPKSGEYYCISSGKSFLSSD